jgi:hypothetical protein
MVANWEPLLLNFFRSIYYTASVATQPAVVVRFTEDPCV